MLDTFRHLGRTLRVVRTGTAIYLGYKRTQRKARGLPGAEADALWAARHERSAERLYRLCIDLKGLYIKAGQFVGTRSDIFPAAYVRWLARLQDSVPPRPPAFIREAVEGELGQPMERLFARFDETALAAASLSQVHRARLHDGREVALKVQYPEVAALVRLDLRTLGRLARLIARLEPTFDYRALVDELAEQLPLELDFVREAEMTRQLRRNLAANPSVVLPEVVDGMVSRHVLVTTFLDGKRFFDHHGEVPAGADPPVVARNLADVFGHQIFLDGIFQADPHPGNLLLLEDGRLAIVDFGLTKELPLNIRRGFARLVVAAGKRDPAEVAAAFREMGVKTKTDSPLELMELTQIFMNSPEEGVGGGPSRSAALRRNPVEALPNDLVLLGRAIGLLRGVCASLGVPLTPLEMLQPYAEIALARLDGADPSCAGGAKVEEPR